MASGTKSSVNSPFSLKLFEYIKSHNNLDELDESVKSFDENEELIPAQLTTQDIKQLRYFLCACDLSEMHLTRDLSLEISASVGSAIIATDLWKMLIVELVGSINPKHPDKTLKFMHRLPQLKNINLHDRVMHIWRVSKRDLFQLVKSSEYEFFLRTWAHFEKHDHVHNVSDLVTALLDVGKIEFAVPRKQKLTYTAVLTDVLSSDLLCPIVVENLRSHLRQNTEQQAFKLNDIVWVPPSAVKDEVFDDISAILRAADLSRPLQLKWFDWLSSHNITAEQQGTEWTKRFKSAFVNFCLEILFANKHLLSESQNHVFLHLIRTSFSIDGNSKNLVNYCAYLRKHDPVNFDVFLYIELLVHINHLDQALNEINDDLKNKELSSNHLSLMAVVFVKKGQLDTATTIIKKASLIDSSFLARIRENAGWFEVTRLLTKQERKRLRTKLKDLLVDYSSLAQVQTKEIEESKPKESTKEPKSSHVVVNDEADKTESVNNEKNQTVKNDINQPSKPKRPKKSPKYKKGKSSNNSSNKQEFTQSSTSKPKSKVASLLTAGNSIKPL